MKNPFLRLLVPFCGYVWIGGAALAAGAYSQDAATIEKGRTLFLQQCAACHALGADSVGPPLGGVTTRFTPEKLTAWIRDPAKVIASGDVRANALLARYKVPMPPFAHLSENDIAAILAFVDQQTDEHKLKPFEIETAASGASTQHWAPPVQKTNLVIELEDVVQIPRLPGRTAYKGITLVRPDPREAGALFVDELMGLIYRVKNRRVSVFLDVRPFFPEFLSDPGVASGVGSFALHPDFGDNGIFYTIHSERFRGTPAINENPPDMPKSELPPLEWVLTEWRLSDPKAVAFAGTHREVLRFVTPTTAHNLQEIAFAPVKDRADPDYGMLYVTCGDGGSANLKHQEIAGHLHSLLGAIWRIDPAGTNGVNGHYGIPADNPFADSQDPAVRKEIWAYGFRNPHRISWDLAHPKRMIAVDIGEANVEEVNVIEKGGAYGWGIRQIEGTAHIEPKVDAKVLRPATAEELAGIHAPFGAYDHSEGSAITGGYVYHGPLSALRDKYIFGDIVNGRLFYMNMGAELSDHTVYELNLARDGAATDIRTLAHAARAHQRISYDERTGDLYITTKDDGMIRRVSAAYAR